VMDVVENRPAGTILGEAKLRGGSHHLPAAGLELRLFPVKVRRLVAASLDATSSFSQNQSLGRVVLTSLRPLDHEAEPVVKFRLVATNPDTQGKKSDRNRFLALLVWYACYAW
jgi:hypothetical protein